MEATSSAGHLHQLMTTVALEQLSDHPEEKMPSLIERPGFVPAEPQLRYQDTEGRLSDTTAAARAIAYTSLRVGLGS